MSLYDTAVRLHSAFKNERRDKEGAPSSHGASVLPKLAFSEAENAYVCTPEIDFSKQKR